MLTGDQNIVNVRFRVSWQIDPAHPEDFVFNILNPRETVKAVAESIMREVVGLKTIDGVLTSDRKSIEPDVQKRMQTVLNDYHAGVLVKQVQLQSVDVPAQVDLRLSRRHRRAAGPAARRQRRLHLRQQRRPRGEGRAPRASSPRRKPTSSRPSSTRNGQTARYNQIYAQYKKAPGVTRERMYLETMERVLGGMSKTILDAPAAQRAGALSGARTVDPEARGSAEMRNPFSGLAILIAVVVGDRRRRLHLLHRRSDRAGAGAALRPAGGRPHRRAGAARQGAVHRLGRLHRQAHSRPRQRAPGGAGRREPAARRRRLRALPHRRSAAVLPIGVERRRAPTRSSAAC